MSDSNVPQLGSGSNLSSFNFQDRVTVRAFPDEFGNPLFVAADVCAALGIANASQAVSRLDDDEKGVTSVYTLGGEQEAITINESGLYALILTSRKAEAKRFKRWVTHEVLPAIRQTGSYSIQPVEPLSPAKALLAAVQQIVEHEERLNEHEDRLRHIEADHAALTDGVEYFSVKGYCKYAHLPSPTEAEARDYGKRAARLSRARSVKIETVPSPEWGTVNRYHRSILSAVFGAIGGTDDAR